MPSNCTLGNPRNQNDSDVSRKQDLMDCHTGQQHMRESASLIFLWCCSTWNSNVQETRREWSWVACLSSGLAGSGFFSVKIKNTFEGSSPRKSVYSY